MSFTKLPLGEAVELTRTGSTPSTSHPEFFKGSIPWFTPGDIGDTRDLVKSTRYISEEGLKSGKAKLFNKEMLLVTCIGDIGRVGVLQQSSSSNQQITALKFKKEIDVYYAYYWFIAHKNKLEQLANQAIVPILNNERLKEVEFFYPPLPEQRRIASMLSRADRLRRLRRVGDSLSDSLLQSVFLEMFGNALNGNNSEIPLVPLESLCIKITDGTHVTPKYLESGVSFVSIKDLTKTPGKIDFSDVKYISREEHEKISKLSNVERDDILYTKVGSYGIAQIVDTDREFSIFVSVALLKPDKTKVLPKFLETVMNSVFVKRQADNLVSGIGVPDLHLREIKTFRIPLPPLHEQEQFAAVVRRVESLRRRAGESERQGEGLFQGLLSQSFGG